jgi:hypothetical protein
MGESVFGYFWAAKSDAEGKFREPAAARFFDEGVQGKQSFLCPVGKLMKSVCNYWHHEGRRKIHLSEVRSRNNSKGFNDVIIRRLVETEL